MKIKNTVHKCNDVIFISKSRYTDKKDRRRQPRKAVTTEKQKKINRRQAEKKLLMLLQLHFGLCGLHLVLSYRNEPESKDRARKEIENFLRRLRYWYAKYGYELKYIQVTEYENKRLHHHIIINGIKEISVSDIQDKIWKNGFVRCTPFEKDGYYNELAAYLIKETSKTFNTTERVFGKRYTSSRNMQLPDPTEEIKQGTETDITDIPLTYTFEGKEYELIKGSEYIGINDYTGLVYTEYAMREIKPRRRRKVKKRKPHRSEGTTVKHSASSYDDIIYHSEVSFAMSNEDLVRWIKKGETSLMADLYMQNKNFIKSIVRHLKISADNKDDAMQDAYLGLAAAVNGFDESKGFKFLTYAKDYIRSAIQRGQSYQMYAPEQIRHTANRLKRIRAELTQQLQRTPTAAEISKISGISANKIDYIINTTKAIKSIYEPLPGTDDMVLGDTIQDTSIDIENDTAEADALQTVRAAVCCLCEQQREVIECIYLKGLNVQQTSNHLGITEKETKTLKNKGLRELRKPSISRILFEDYIDSRTSFYNHIGIKKYNNTWISSTERAVMDREQLRRKVQ